VAKFEDTYNELALLGEPVTEASKVRLFCKSLKEKFMKASAIDTQMSKETALSFSLAMAHLNSVRDLHVMDGADKDERQVSELGKRKGGGGGPWDRARRKEAAPEAPEEASNFTVTATRSGSTSPRPLRPR
jgi:hypothetical protein